MHPRHIFSRVKSPAKSLKSKHKLFCSTHYNSFKENSIVKPERMPFAFSILKPIKMIKKWKLPKKLTKSCFQNSVEDSNKLSQCVSLNSTSVEQEIKGFNFNTDYTNDYDLSSRYLDMPWEPKLEIR